MGRRVLTVSDLTFHQKFKRNPASFAPADLDGEDLIEIFHNWAASRHGFDTHNEQRQTWVSITEASRYAPRVEVLDLRVGSYGEPGEVVDIDTGEPVGEIQHNQAPTGQNRALLFVPEHGERAYFLAEESTRGSAGGHILGLFKKHFSNYTDRITLKTSTVTEGEAWAEAAELTEVEVRVAGQSGDVADGLKVKVGRISYIARPEKRHRFPGRLLGALHREETLKRVVSVPDLPDEREVFVTMVREGRTKKFQLGTESAPAIREVLNDSAEDALDIATLVDTCAEKVTELCQRTGGEWNKAWSRPPQQVG